MLALTTMVPDTSSRRVRPSGEPACSWRPCRGIGDPSHGIYQVSTRSPFRQIVCFTLAQDQMIPYVFHNAPVDVSVVDMYALRTVNAGVGLLLGGPKI
ncbi:hypothetical protein MTO96_022465 [Rhipicephalus appendiculatus]